MTLTDTWLDRTLLARSTVWSMLPLSITTRDDEYVCASRYSIVRASVSGSRLASLRLGIRTSRWQEGRRSSLGISGCGPEVAAASAGARRAFFATGWR